MAPARDVAPVLNLLAADEELCEALLLVDQEIVQIVAQLGGSGKNYRRERAQQVKFMISEIYSTARVTKALKMMPHLDLTPGFAYVLTNCDENGEPWDFSRKEMRDKAYANVEKEKPYMLVGPPSCSPYCSFQHLNAVRHE